MLGDVYKRQLKNIPFLYFVSSTKNDWAIGLTKFTEEDFLETESFVTILDLISSRLANADLVELIDPSVVFSIPFIWKVFSATDSLDDKLLSIWSVILINLSPTLYFPAGIVILPTKTPDASVLKVVFDAETDNEAFAVVLPELVT